MPRTVFAASATAFSAAFAKLSLGCSDYINNFSSHLWFSFDFDSVRIVPRGLASRPLAVLRPGGHGYGVRLAMHRMTPEYIDAYRAYGSVAVDVLLRQEPDEEEDEEEDDRNKEDDDDDDTDDGYSE